jgi:hypothetical protein
MYEKLLLWLQICFVILPDILVVLINILFLLFPQYCRAMRDQILESFNHRDFSIMVVGNKYDLIAESNPHTQVGIHNISFFFINCL